MTIKSAIVDNEVFIQGEYLSIGINRDGSLGTRKAAPASFSSDKDAGFLRTGMFADLDGFGRGAETKLHDAVLLGRAIEGFNIGYKTGGKTFVQSNQSLTGYGEVKGVNSNASTSMVGQAHWKGETSEKLGVSQKITLSDDAKYIRIDVTLTNNSTAALTDLQYMRTADPDHGPTFGTNNKILRQGDDDGALVASYVGNSTPFFLFSEDNRAVVSTYGFVNTDPYEAAAYKSKQTEGYTKSADQTVNITFGLGTLDPGESETITLYMGVTDDLAKTIAAIENFDDRDDDNTGDDDRDDDDGDDDRDDDDGDDDDRDDDDRDDDDRDDDDRDDGDDDEAPAPEPVDLAPAAKDDTLALNQDKAGRGNVLSNDSDPEGGKLTASLKSGPANGTVSLSADGSFVYTPKTGFSGTDKFTYAASDGKNSDVATVTLTVEAVEPPPPPPAPPPPTGTDVIGRAGTVDGCSSANQTLTGAAYANTFFFDVAAKTGADRITNFGNDDVIAINRALFDGNGDGIIGLSKGRLSIDAPKTADVVTINGVSALRFLGTDSKGMAVYADAGVRPRGATESKLGDDRFSGDAMDVKKNVFFFDTALDIDLGSDAIVNFGARDVIVTTSALADGNGDGKIKFGGGELNLGNAGSVELSTLAGGAVGSLELDGTVVRDGTTYYVYSLDGSAAGLADLAF